MKKLMGAALMCLPFLATADTLYLCEAYAGGQFWSSGHCSKNQALIKRMFEVPGGLPFDQQVALGQQQLNSSTGSVQAANVQRTAQASGTRAECAALKDRIVQLDALARQPQTGQTQDRIKEEKKQVRDRQFRLRC